MIPEHTKIDEKYRSYAPAIPYNVSHSNEQVCCNKTVLKLAVFIIPTSLFIITLNLCVCLPGAMKTVTLLLTT